MIKRFLTWVLIVNFSGMQICLAGRIPGSGDVVLEMTERRGTGVLVNASIDITPDETAEAFDDFLTSHGLVEAFPEGQKRDALKTIWQAEQAWPNKARWGVLDRALEKAMLLPATGWMWGSTRPLDVKRTMQQVAFAEGLRQGSEFILFRGAHLAITGIGLYQLSLLFQDPPTTCAGPVYHSIPDLLADWWHQTDKNALNGLFHSLLQVGFRFPLLFIPSAAWGDAKGAYGAIDVGRTDQGRLKQVTQEMRNDLEVRLPGRVPAGLHNVWRNKIRWLLPVHPLDSKLNTLARHFLWDGKLTSEMLEEIFGVLEDMATRPGYTKIPIQAILGRFLESTHQQDMRRAHVFNLEVSTLDPHVGERIPGLATRLALKVRTRALLQRLGDPNLVFEQESKKTFGRTPLGVWRTLKRCSYPRYLLWKAGLAEGRLDHVFFGLTKPAKLGALVYFMIKLFEAWNKAESCPKEPGVNVGGVAPWADEFTQSCVRAASQAYNIIPGQPPQTLTDLIKKAHMPCKIEVDLSGKDMTGFQVAAILKGYHDQSIKVTRLDASGNKINTDADVEAFLSAPLQDIEWLSLASNGIGSTLNSSRTFGMSRLARGLNPGVFPALRSLYLSFNPLSVPHQADAPIITALGNLNLTRLILNRAQVTNTPQHASQLGQSLRRLENLQELNLAWTLFAEGFPYSMRRTAFYDVIGGIRPALRGLDLHKSHIPTLTLEDDASQLREIFSTWPKIRTLNVSDAFGFARSQDDLAMTVASALPTVSQPLTALDLSANSIGTTFNGTIAASAPETMQIIAQNIAQLPHLKELTRFFVFNAGTNETLQIINRALAHTQAPAQRMIVSPALAQAFCDTLDTGTRSLDSSSLVSSPTDATFQALIQCVSEKVSNLTSLSFYLSGINPTPTVFKSLGIMTGLRSLNLYGNFFPNKLLPEAMAAFEYHMGRLHNLETLHIQFEATSPDNVAEIIFKTAQSWSHLKELDFVGTTFSSEALNLLGPLNLDILSLQGSHFSCTNMDWLGQMTALKTLVILGSNFGDTASCARALSVNLKKLPNLEELVLAKGLFDDPAKGFECADDGDGSATTMALAEGLAPLTKLRSLRLDRNCFGRADNRGVQALVAALQGKPNLQKITMIENEIGRHGAEGADAFVNMLVTLPELDFSELQLQGMRNVSWTGDSIQAFQSLQSSAMEKACDASRCQSSTLHVDSKGNVQSTRRLLQDKGDRAPHHAWSILSPVTSLARGVQTSILIPTWNWLDRQVDRAVDGIISYAKETVEATPHYRSDFLLYDRSGQRTTDWAGAFHVNNQPPVLTPAPMPDRIN